MQLLNIFKQVLNMLVGNSRVEDRLTWYNNQISALRAEFYRLLYADHFEEALDTIHKVERLEARRSRVLRLMTAA